MFKTSGKIPITFSIEVEPSVETVFVFSDLEHPVSKVKNAKIAKSPFFIFFLLVDFSFIKNLTKR